MIFGPALEPNHHLEEYLAFDGDDEDFLQTDFEPCIYDEDGADIPCVECGHCEDKYFACSEDEYDAKMEKDDYDTY